MRRISGLLVIICLWWTNYVQAQDLDEIFNSFVQQNQQSFNSFTDSINRQFASAMEANMKTFAAEQPQVRDPKPKPHKLPEIKKDNVPDLPRVVPQQSIIDNSHDSIPTEQDNKLGFNLFGENVLLAKKPFPETLTAVSAEAVSDFWIQLSECDYKEMLQCCQIARQQQAFNDWAVYQLVLRLAQKTYSQQYNEQVVMTVFLLNQLGMEAKVGFGETHLFCLVAVEQKLYGIPFSVIDGKRYYILEFDPNFKPANTYLSFKTYDIPFPESTHSLDMNIRQPLKSHSSYSVTDKKTDFVNMSMIELFKTYPQVAIDVYANATPSEEFVLLVNNTIRPRLKGLSAYDAVSYILSYLQYSFDYANDEEQFGFEKPFFCEENYYYAHNDCEDRSILFSFLVRKLLNLDVVFIDYSGHLATAVHFPTEVAGEYVEYQGKKYVICDPSYIGASIGMEMPDHAPSERSVIPIGH